MKKTAILCTVFFVLGAVLLFAVSYDNNEYQRKSRAYSELARRAYSEGDYDASIEYSRLAEENAQKSADYIQYMLARVEAEQAMNRARTRYTWAKNNKAEEKYPEAFKTATEALQAGNTAFGNKDFDVAVVCAKKVLDALAVVTGDESSFATLPAQYRIRTWRGERDCLWNIAKDKAIYDNPYLWRKLYEANKNKLPDPNNPDWVEPGIILTIPSLRGEKRDGMYDPAVTYEKLPSGKK
ncbi:MAG: hypothetical protein ACFNYQ_07655 [Treponema sp.]|jgi:treponemal membrane protein B|uniref:DUF4398 domain-containing protein n=1 Tax=Treponema vincentii TaxID=69710 RepID=A0A6P1Y456_9SPIR|nr:MULTISPECIES: DUF4398 domain-containing protein [Treponema]QHX43702.1 DUF4398 domain-containing protein [Treponema vincentii]UTC52505.1 DUF4398 domain-containing protein [Treponema sp. OMZ 803]UTC54917.1 DUF4398 domain-containing protein [Treponema sp. OMZ 906]